MARGLFFLGTLTKATMLLAAVLVAGTTKHAMAEASISATGSHATTDFQLPLSQ